MILSAVGSAGYLSFDSLTLYNLILSHLVKFIHSLSHTTMKKNKDNLPFDDEEEDPTDTTVVSYLPTYPTSFL